LLSDFDSSEEWRVMQARFFISILVSNEKRREKGHVEEQICLRMEKRLIISIKEADYLLDPNEITYINAEGSYCVIVSTKMFPLKVSKNLLHVMTLIPDGCPFLIRVHRSWVINVNRVSAISRMENHYYAILHGGMRVPVSTRTIKDQILAAFKTGKVEINIE
jgi:DNA-binding LytR/AlgR family response regulator